MGEAVRPGRPPSSQQWPPKSGYGKRWALLISVTLAILLLVFDGEPEPPGLEVTQVPEEVVGRWSTGDPRYQDRALVVTSATVTLEVGAGVPPQRGEISGIRRWMEGESSVVRIAYVTTDGPQEIDLLLEGPNRMRLRNPSEVLWTKTGR